MVKRRRGSGGRVTPSKRTATPAATLPPHAGPPRASPLERDRPEPSARYTPPAPAFRLRPAWHRVAGWLGVLVGVLIAVLNDAMVLVEDVTLLPGGHLELYLLIGIAVAGASSWFLGLFDRGTTIYG